MNFVILIRLVLPNDSFPKIFYRFQIFRAFLFCRRCFTSSHPSALSYCERQRVRSTGRFKPIDLQQQKRPIFRFHSYFVPLLVSFQIRESRIPIRFIFLNSPSFQLTLPRLNQQAAVRPSLPVSSFPTNSALL